MKRLFAHFVETHSINKFIELGENKVVVVEAVRMYDNERDEYEDVKDTEIISAWCYYALNNLDEYLHEELDEFIESKNPHWEIDEVIFA